MSRHPSADKRRRFQPTEHGRLSCRHLALLLIGTVLSTAPAQLQAQTIYSDQTIYLATFTGSTGGTCTTDGSFATATGWGRRYHVVVKNGATHATSVTLSIDGEEWIGSSEFSSSVDSLTRIVEITHAVEGQNTTHSIDVCVVGPLGSSVSVRIYHLTEPTFVVFGPYTFTRLEPIANDITSFLNSDEATTPHELRVRNGAVNGANRVSNATLHLNDSQTLSASDFGTGVATITRSVSPMGPAYFDPGCQCVVSDVWDVVKGRNESGTGTYFTARIHGTDASVPSLTVNTNSPTEGLVTEADAVTISGSANDGQTKVLVTASDSTTGAANTPVRGNGNFSDTFTLSADRKYTIKVRAENSAGLAASNVFRHVTRDRLNPSLSVNWPPAVHAVSSDSVAIHVSWADTSHTYITIDGDTVASGKYGVYSTVNYPVELGPNRIILRAQDALGHATTVIRTVLRTMPSDSPISPPTPSVLSSTETTPFRDGIAFLFSGAGSVQTGAIADSIKADRAVVIRGRVLARDHGPIPNVVVRVLGRSYYGETKTRADGQFDLVVNGGGPLVLRFSKLGYLEAQRQIDPPVNSFLTVDDVALIGRSTKFAVVDLESPKVVRGQFATDANGDREIRLYFPGAMRARITNTSTPADSELRHVRVRATEFTQGGQGLPAMPSLLPPSSAYTYCVEFSLDEADSIANLSGQPSSVRFTSPVLCYVRNFLSYPVGTRVPYGYFDRVGGQWVAEDDAVVLKIVGASGDTALVDSNGDNQADSPALLDALQLSGAERRVLLAQYGVNGVLWRARLTHFTPGDLNPNAGPPQDPLPTGPPPIFRLLALLFGPCLSSGSIIECENRVLGERLPVTGTPYALNYRSFRAPADLAVRTARVPIIGNTVPASLVKILVALEVAGKVYKQEFPQSEITAGKIASLTWDGLDAYGRRVEGSVSAQVRVGYVYQMSVRGGGGSRGGFANSAMSATTDLAVSGDRAVSPARWTQRSILLGVPGTGADALGGWTLSPHHVFDPKGRGTVYYGSGEVDAGDRIPLSRWTYAPWRLESGQCPDFDNQLIPATGIRPSALTVAPDGTVYFANSCNGSIYRVGKDRIAHRVAGTGAPGNFNPNADGGPARNALLRGIKEIVLGRDGTLHLTAQWGAFNPADNYGLICKVTPDGTLRRVIGDGDFHQYGGGDNGPVSSATTVEISTLAVGPDGELYFAEEGTGPNGAYVKVRRVGTDGIITTYAGSEYCRNSTDSTGRAIDICLGTIRDLEVDAGGNLYILEGPNHRVRRVSPEGRISTSLSIQNSLFSPNAMSLAPDGSIYLANGSGSASQQGLDQHGVYRLDPDGSIFIVAGGTSTGSSFDGVPVTMAPLLDVTKIAVLPDGSYYVVSDGRGVAYVTQKFATDLGNEWMIPSPDGSEVHFFTKTGRHLRTRDALTGTLRHWFTYDATHGDLLAVHDADGGTTTIVRNGTSRVPEKIQAPEGQETILTLTNGWLTRVLDPGGNVTSLAYSTGGLLDSLTDANNHRSSFTWDAKGRLNRDTDAAAGFQNLTPSTEASRLRTIWRDTALGRRTIYEVTSRDDGTTLRKVTSPAGHVTSRDEKVDTRVETTLPDGTVVTESIARDPRFSIVAPVPASTTVRLPSGLTRTVQVSRPYNAATFDPPTVATTSWIEQVLVNGSDTVSTEFELASRRLTIQRSLARTTKVTVDTAGRPIAIHVPGLDTLRREYDARGRLSKVRQGDRVWCLGYDVRGRLEFVRDTLGRMTTYGYNSADRLTSQTMPGNRTIYFDYDPAGNLKSLTPPGGRAHGFDYTPVDVTSKYRPPGAGLADSLTEYLYNLDRQLTDVLRPDGADITLAYSGGTGRIDRVTTPRGDAYFSYDAAAGRLATLTSPDSVTLSYGYDGPADTTETWTGAVSGTVSVALDPNFRVASQRVNGGETAVYGYDRDGLVTQAGSLTIARRVDNGLISGTTLAGSNLTTSESHNPFGEVAFSVALNGADTLWRAVYARDPLGRITAIAERVLGASSQWVFAYSDTGFLSSVAVTDTVKELYAYDVNGNRLRFDAPGDGASGTYDDQDRLIHYGNTDYTYTAAGELAAKIIGTDTTRFNYDPFGNLVKVRLPNGDSLNYVVDGRNRRVARKLNGAVTQRWLYQDQIEPVAELDGSGNLIARYVYGTRGHVPDYVVKDDTTFRIIADHLGSVRLVVNAETGMIAQRLDYDGYGRVTYDSNPGFQCFGYAGGLWDGATGLVRFGARDYDPETGRWTSRDPIGFTGGPTNLLSYVGNDPVNRIDPTGLKTEGSAGNAPPGLRCVQSILETLGYVDPTGVLDGVNAALYALRGEWGYAAISAAAILPFGDAFKLAARFDISSAGHIFREAAGHVNPASGGSQARFARLFESVASNPANLRADAVQTGLITQQAAEAGVQAFTWAGRAGQVWVTVRNGVIQNAGVNPLGAFR